MITDEQRSKVAERMRGYDVSEFKESAIVPFLDCLGVGYLNWREILDSLADLIDRQTCHLIEDEDGYTACSECGCTALCMRDATYCPACGRVIVND